MLEMFSCYDVLVALHICITFLCQRAADIHAVNGINTAVKQLWQEIERRKEGVCLLWDQNHAS